jgi:hypothetical protein
MKCGRKNWRLRKGHYAVELGLTYMALNLIQDMCMT